MFKMPDTIQIRLVKDPKPAPAPCETPARRTTEDHVRLVKKVGVIAGAVYAGNKILNTGCEIAIIAAKAKIR